MKNIINLAFLVTSLIFFGSCEEKDQIQSKTTFFATFNFEDGENVAWDLGNPYIDSEVIATENGEAISVVVNGLDDVDVSTVGVYPISYSAQNSDGFSAVVTRNVIVHDPSIIGSDITGKIQDKGRNERKGKITLVDGTTSIFFATDFAFGGIFPMYFQMNGDIISEISQPYVFGVTNVDLTYDANSREFTTIVFPQKFNYAFEYE